MEFTTLEGIRYTTTDISFKSNKSILDKYIVNLNTAKVYEVTNPGFDIDNTVAYWVREFDRKEPILRDYNELLENFSGIKEIRKEV